MSSPVCTIVGIGPKNASAFARRFAAAGFRIMLLSRGMASGEDLVAA